MTYGKRFEHFAGKDFEIFFDRLTTFFYEEHIKCPLNAYYFVALMHYLGKYAQKPAVGFDGVDFDPGSWHGINFLLSEGLVSPQEFAFLPHAVLLIPSETLMGFLNANGGFGMALINDPLPMYQSEHYRPNKTPQARILLDFFGLSKPPEDLSDDFGSER